ncbi:hypothetical protein OAM89_00440 [bacterium]|jgi:hypothetical protein|nr:hypothetical protein [bacterium]|tara:strand:- start:1899 stop:2045 length:147 start_codon:yes stop_codon:yes gene_type:complete
MPTNKTEYMREYMRKRRAAGKVKHWRQYQIEKEAREKLKKARKKKGAN